MKTINELAANIEWAIITKDISTRTNIDLDSLLSLAELIDSHIPKMVKGSVDSNGCRIEVCPNCGVKLFSQHDSKFCGECGHAIKYQND